MAAPLAPAVAMLPMRQAPGGSSLVRLSSQKPSSAPSAPSAISASHWAGSGSRGHRRLAAHTTSSHDSTANIVTTVPLAVSASHWPASRATRAVPSASSSCTPSTARSTRPTWQTSKARVGSSSGAELSSGSCGSSVAVKPSHWLSCVDSCQTL